MKLNNEQFYSVPKFEAEFKDKDGVIKSRSLWQDTILTSDFEKTLSKTDFISGAVELTLSKNISEADIRFSDKNILSIRKLNIKDSSSNNYSDSERIGKPIFLFEEKPDTKVYQPYIAKNNVLFSSHNSEILIPVSFKNEFTKYFYSCKFNDDKRNTGLKWSSNFKIESFTVPERNKTLTIIRCNKDTVEIGTKSLNHNDSGLYSGLIRITLPVEETVPGDYELKIVKDGNKDTSTYKFSVIWEDMPVILQKPRFALESMYYILKDDEYERMLDEDEENYSKEIIDYWKKEDLSKFTPYNESMAEYFKRVDYSMFNLKTMNEKNGVKTDRGKIYILYGPPDNIDRNLNEDKALELWKYERLKKTFVFKAIMDGIFKLVEIQEK